MLTEREKAIVKARFALMLPPEREAMVVFFQKSDNPELAKFAEDICRELSVPESQIVRRTETSELTPEQVRAFWKSVRMLGGAGAIIATGVAGMAYMIIPFLIALGGALVLIAPYVAGGALVVLAGVVVVRSIRRTKEIDQSERGGTIINNFYFEQNIRKES